jgi:hypothetical protein
MPEGAPARRSPPPIGALLAGLVASAIAFGPAGTPVTGGEAVAAPPCEPGGDPVVLEGEIAADEAETYLLLPVEVAAGTTRIEVGYEWADVRPAESEDPGNETVLDLGLWDADGTEGPEAFRGWSGSRQGLTAEGQEPVFLQADGAERGFVAGAIEPGTWNVELGVGFVAEDGATYAVTVECLDPDVGPAAELDPVDPEHVARDEPGWYVGDLHLHAYHSNPEGLAGQDMVDSAVAAGLDFIPITEYVTPAHWWQLGEVQEANPDVVIWPGREVITYAGHAIVLGETPGTVEYRQGFEGHSLHEVQAVSGSDGALFGIAHPTIFPGEAGAELCRGCSFELADEVEWSRVDTVEVVTTGALLDGGFEPDPVDGTVENPFVATAIDLWEAQLQAGNHITAVGGSDDKQGDQYGSAATAVWAEQLSREALADALQTGHAYVLARGTEHSPELELAATGPDGIEGTFGDTIVVEPGRSADVRVEVRGGDGQTLLISRLGEPVEEVPVEGDAFTYDFAAERAATGDEEGPLGTFWRIDVRDERSLTAIGNPVFLADVVPEPVDRSEPDLYETVHPPPDRWEGGEAHFLPLLGIAVVLGIGVVVLLVVVMAAYAGWAAWDRRRGPY